MPPAATPRPPRLISSIRLPRMAGGELQFTFVYPPCHQKSGSSNPGRRQKQRLRRCSHALQGEYRKLIWRTLLRLGPSSFIPTQCQSWALPHCSARMRPGSWTQFATLNGLQTPRRKCYLEQRMYGDVVTRSLDDAYPFPGHYGGSYGEKRSRASASAFLDRRQLP